MKQGDLTKFIKKTESMSKAVDQLERGFLNIEKMVEKTITKDLKDNQKAMWRGIFSTDKLLQNIKPLKEKLTEYKEIFDAIQKGAKRS